MTVDARGLKCPLPRLKVELALRELKSGEEVVLLSDDKESPLDISAWCADQGHEILEQSEEHGVWRFSIKKS